MDRSTYLYVCFTRRIKHLEYSYPHKVIEWHIFKIYIQSQSLQLVRFLVLELTHLDLNPRFDMSVVFTTNYSFSGMRRLR
jgi:hypothetical protein